MALSKGFTDSKNNSVLEQESLDEGKQVETKAFAATHNT